MSDNERLQRLIAEVRAEESRTAAATAVYKPQEEVAPVAESIPPEAVQEAAPEPVSEPVAVADPEPEPAVESPVEAAAPAQTPEPSPVVAGTQPEPPAEPPQAAVSRTRITIQPETVVEITVDEDQSLSGTYEVNSASAIQFRYVGLVFLGNMTTSEATVKIKSLLIKERGFRNANVAVRIVKASYDTIRVSGWVNEPTDLKIGPGSQITLRDALLRAKGLRSQAKGTRITIARDGLLNPIPLTGRVNEEYSLMGPDGKASIPRVAVRGNDWVHVSPGDEQVGLGEKQIVVMMLSQPSVVRFSNNEPCTMMYLLVKIGKLPKWVDSGNVRVVRKGQDGLEAEIKVDIRPILEAADSKEDIALEHGDRVIFKERRLPFLP
ncbi:MAG: polysaccharide biosynthesis/export family protein [bacterium]